MRANKAFAEALKMPEEEILGRTVFDLYSAKIAQDMTDDDQEVFQSGQPKLNIIEQYESASGLRWVQTDKIPIFGKNGIPVGLIGFAQDITERKQAEEALRHERDFAQGLVNTAQAIVLTLDTESRIIHFNPYMEEISGYHLEEVKGKDWFTTFLPERNREKTRELFLTAISDIQTRGNIDAILTKDGQERDIVWYDKTLKDSSGNVIGLLTIGQDITERKRLEENLEKERQDFIFHFCNYIF